LEKFGSTTLSIENLSLGKVDSPDRHGNVMHLKH